MTFTVTTTGTEFFDALTALTGSEPGSGGLVTLRDLSWLLSLTIFHQPEVTRPAARHEGLVGLRPVSGPHRRFRCETDDRMHRRGDPGGGAAAPQFDQHLDAIMASSICIPCHLPFVNNIWLPRKQSDRPSVVPEGATNLGLIGQYVEVPQDIAFTVEYSARTAWEAIRALTKRGPEPPPVYQAQYDPTALLAALTVLLGR